MNIKTIMAALAASVITATTQARQECWDGYVYIERAVCPAGGKMQMWLCWPEADTWAHFAKFDKDEYALLNYCYPQEEESWGTKAFVMVDKEGFATSACILDDAKRDSFATRQGTVYGLGTNDFTRAELTRLVKMMKAGLPKVRQGTTIVIR